MDRPALAEVLRVAALVALVAGLVAQAAGVVAARAWMAPWVALVAQAQTELFVSFGALVAHSLTTHLEVNHAIRKNTKP